MLFVKGDTIISDYQGQIANMIEILASVQPTLYVTHVGIVVIYCYIT